MNIQPIGENVVVRPKEQDDITESGIVIQRETEEAPTMGEVIAVGDNMILGNGVVADVKLEAGDTVIFNKYAPQEVEVDGEELLMIGYKDLRAKVIN